MKITLLGLNIWFWLVWSITTILLLSPYPMNEFVIGMMIVEGILILTLWGWVYHNMVFDRGYTKGYIKCSIDNVKLMTRLNKLRDKYKSKKK